MLNLHAKANRRTKTSSRETSIEDPKPSVKAASIGKHAVKDNGQDNGIRPSHAKTTKAPRKSLNERAVKPSVKHRRPWSVGEANMALSKLVGESIDPKVA